MIYSYNKILSGNKKEQINVQNNIDEFQNHIGLSSSNYVIYFCEILEFEKSIYNEKKTNLWLPGLRVAGVETWTAKDKGGWGDI